MERILKEIDELFDATNERKAFDEKQIHFINARKKQAESILKDIACFDHTSDVAIEEFSARAKNYFKPIAKTVKEINF